jgi:serine/threonine-protein phosphatase PGAM5
MRTVILVRHGQYSRNPEKLTPLGRKQAHFAARALKDVEASELVSSTMPRAIETAKIIGKHLKLSSSKKSMFREAALPILSRDFEHVYGTKKPSRKGRRKLKQLELKNARRADLAFRTLFKKPVNDDKKTIILVAHGNVIRYWMCRALKIDVKKWLLMGIYQCSITTIRIDSKGKYKILGFSDSGHIPLKFRTIM